MNRLWCVFAGIERIIVVRPAGTEALWEFKLVADVPADLVPAVLVAAPAVAAPAAWLVAADPWRAPAPVVPVPDEW